MTNTLPLQSLAVWRDSRGKIWDGESGCAASGGPVGFLWWQNPMCLLINALSFGSLSLTLCACRGRLESAFRSESQTRIKFYSRSPHEYLIWVAAITHFPVCSSPCRCPRWGCVFVCVYVSVFVIACVCVCVCLYCSASWSSRRVLRGRSLPWSVQVCVPVQLLLLQTKTVNMVRLNTQHPLQEITRPNALLRNNQAKCITKNSLVITSVSLFYSLSMSVTHNKNIIITTWRVATNITLFLSLWPPQRAVPDRIWLISGSVWGTGSSYCRATPSRTITASLGPKPLQPAPHQVRATMSWILSALRGNHNT